MRRLFWVAVGAAGGIWAYQRGSETLERARERGVIGNVGAATAAAGRLTATGARAVAAASETGARVATRLTTRPDAKNVTPGARSDSPVTRTTVTTTSPDVTDLPDGTDSEGLS